MLGVSDIQDLFRSRDADVAEPPLLFEAVRIGNRPLVRKQAVLQAAQKYEWKLEPLCRVHGHELHTVFPRFRLALASLECGMREKLVERRHFFGGVRFETLGGADQFHHVLEFGFATLSLVVAKHVNQAAGVNYVVDLVLQVESGGLPSHLLDEVHEDEHCVRRSAGEFVAGDGTCRSPH